MKYYFLSLCKFPCPRIPSFSLEGWAWRPPSVLKVYLAQNWSHPSTCYTPEAHPYLWYIPHPPWKFCMSVKARKKQIRFLDAELPSSCMLFYTSKLPNRPHIATLIIFVSSLAHSCCSCFHRCTRKARGQVQFSCFSFESFVQQTIKQLDFD